MAIRRGRSAALALALAAAAPAAAQEAQPVTTFRSNALEVNLNGRVQTQFNTSSVDEVPPTEWVLRRARLDVRLRVNELVSGRVQAEFAGPAASVVDAFMRLRFDPGLELLAGRAHKPFGRLEQTSSARILPIERGLHVRGLEGAFDQYRIGSALGYSGRDVGLQVMGAPATAPLGLTYALGVFRGPAAGRAGDRDTRQLAARTTISPAATLRFGAGWSARNFAGTAAAPDASPALRTGHAFELDLEYGAEAQGPRVLAEVSRGDVDPFDAARFTGAQLWAGYRFVTTGPRLTGVEPLVRASRAGVPGDLGGTLLTPGLNLYVGGWNRVSLNLDVWLPAGDGAAETSFKTQFQLVF